MRAAALILGVSRHRAKRLLERLAHLSHPEGEPPTYDARILDYLRNTHGGGPRELAPVDRDWLTRYQKGQQ